MVHHAAVDMDMLDKAMGALSEALAVFDCLAAVNLEQLADKTVEDMAWLGMKLLCPVQDFLDCIVILGSDEPELTV